MLVPDFKSPKELKNQLAALGLYFLTQQRLFEQIDGKQKQGLIDRTIAFRYKALIKELTELEEVIYEGNSLLNELNLKVQQAFNNNII